MLATGKRALAPLAWLLVATLAASTVAGCASTGRGSGGTFTPRVEDTLTVAAAQIPDPGFWYGTFAHPTGGFEYGLAKALAKRFGLNRIRVIEVPFHELVRGQLGGADLALSDITISDERAEHLDFSTSYLEAPPSVLVRAGTEVPDVNAARDMHWAVQRDTTLKEALESSIEPTTSTLVFEHQREALAALRSGRAGAVMLDLPVALAYARSACSRSSCPSRWARSWALRWAGKRPRRFCWARCWHRTR